jgi:hypothetical protein
MVVRRLPSLRVPSAVERRLEVGELTLSWLAAALLASL